MPDSAPSNLRLVQRAIKGDVEAFGALYERHMQEIYRYAYYRVGNVLDAEDLTELTFLRVWEHRDRFNPERTSLRTWLFRVAHNLIVDHHRTSKPVESLEEMQPRDSQPGPEQRAVMSDESRTLGAAIRRLKPDYQQVLTLRFVTDLSHAETAQIMGRSEGAVRILQYRALRALKEALTQTKGVAS